jgi:predicted transcriptional regulator YheO
MYYGMIKYRKERIELIDELCDMGAQDKTSLAFNKDEGGDAVAVFGVNMDMSFEDARFMIVAIEPRNNFIDRFFNVASQNISLKTFRLKQ